MQDSKTGRLKMGQIRQGKYSCLHCGALFTPKNGAKGTHCSLSCVYKSKVKSSFDEFPSFIKCTACHAKIGFGCGVSARIIKKDKSTVARAWHRLGIESALPDGGSWRVAMSKLSMSKLTWWGGNGAANAWMSEYKVKFPDWSAIYREEVAKKSVKKYQRELYHKLPKHHPYHLKKICRSRIYKAVKRSGSGDSTRKANRTTQLIGCSMQNLKAHLESKFKSGMTWDNYGSKWHIDHIIPCASFDFTNPDEIFKCFHYTNLQPLWAHENLSKSDKIIHNGIFLTRGRLINASKST